MVICQAKEEKEKERRNHVLGIKVRHSFKLEMDPEIHIAYDHVIYLRAQPPSVSFQPATVKFGSKM